MIACGNASLKYLRGETSEKSKKENNTQYENDSLSVVDGDENLTSNDLEFASAEGESRPMPSRRLPVWHEMILL